MNVLEKHILDVETKLSRTAMKNALFNKIKEMEDIFVNTNIDQINLKSEDIFGKDIGFYSKGTEKIAKGRKKEGQPFTGDDTGEWFDGFYLKIQGDSLLFGSTDVEKNKSIFGSQSTWLSKDLFGLTDESLNFIIERDLLPSILIYVRKSLGI